WRTSIRVAGNPSRAMACLAARSLMGLLPVTAIRSVSNALLVLVRIHPTFIDTASSGRSSARRGPWRRGAPFAAGVAAGFSVDVSGVTILICTHNRSAQLARTLDCVAQLAAGADCSVDVLVVDNNSSDATRDVVA